MTPIADSARTPQEQVEDGTPFVALPFSDKVVARLTRNATWTEGQHDVTASSGDLMVSEAAAIVVRHLTLPARAEVGGKRTHGLHRAATGHSPEIGWQAQRLAEMTDEELDVYWRNNSWRRDEDGAALVGAYRGLVEDDALVRVGHELDRWAASSSRSHTLGGAGSPPSCDIPAIHLERALERLIDEAGGAVTAAASEQAAVLADLQRAFDERSEWALQLVELLARRDDQLRRLRYLRHLAFWRWGHALRLASSSRRSGRS